MRQRLDSELSQTPSDPLYRRFLSNPAKSSTNTARMRLRPTRCIFAPPALGCSTATNHSFAVHGRDSTEQTTRKNADYMTLLTLPLTDSLVRCTKHSFLWPFALQIVFLRDSLSQNAERRRHVESTSEVGFLTNGV